MKNINTSKFWDQKLFRESSDLASSPIYIHKNNIVLRHVSKIPGPVLDIGFGNGYLEELITQNDFKNKLYGIDISKYAIYLLNVKFGKTFVNGKITDIPFKDKKFDIVIALDILEHIPKSKISIALSEVNRVLGNNGKFIVSVPVNESPVDSRNNGHLRNYTKIIFINEMERSGFEVEKIYSLYAFKSYYFIKSLINQYFFKIKKPNLLIFIMHKS